MEIKLKSEEEITVNTPHGMVMISVSESGFTLVNAFPDKEHKISAEISTDVETNEKSAEICMETDDEDDDY